MGKPPVAVTAPVGGVSAAAPAAAAPAAVNPVVPAVSVPVAAPVAAPVAVEAGVMPAMPLAMEMKPLATNPLSLQYMKKYPEGMDKDMVAAFTFYQENNYQASAAVIQSMIDDLNQYLKVIKDAEAAQAAAPPAAPAAKK